MTKKKYSERIIFRVDEAVFKWWEEKCNKEGLKKGEPFQKAIELAYMKDHESGLKEAVSKDVDCESSLFFEVESEIKEKLSDEAKKKKKSQSELINEILKERYLKKDSISVNSLEVAENRTFRFKPSFYQSVAEAAKNNKMNTTRFVMAVLAAKISSDSFFFNEAEFKALGKSNTQLLAIGRNLNQMAKNMNQDIYEAYDRQFVIALNEMVKDHVKQVFKLLEQNKKMWE